ncbi:MAG: c-type cytochrome [Opitutus sp.]|nr:c-type cytochrome [Opitutus sp.]
MAPTGPQSLAVWLATIGIGATAFASDGWRPINTQPVGEPFPPREAAARLHAPPGFKITLAAAEPDLQQPIAIAYDDRGRLWVAESYSYAGSNFTDERHDRILIFEDTDGDGVFDSRKVFHDQLNRLTGLALGFGGVWITTAPHLAFIPDQNGDDVPDGPPVVQLDGWTLEAEHNTVNGLTWGPDGWLYGRHGIKKSSLVGRPGAPKSSRTEVSCAIWRFHPTRHTFEVVADGTINPWGLDFDDHGQAFASTSVVDHFWHVVPGARWERWKDRGGHPDPHSYELMSPTSDHLHWGGGMWDKDGRIAGSNDALGGGHSHSDAMIYLGDRWPAEYRGTVFMSNIHGRRINRDAIERRPGDGRYVATHRPDFITVADPWFRAISLAYGPDGDAVMTDWSDFGECHDRDGVHRSSGRIYKISWGEPRKVTVDLGRESNAALVAHQLNPNDWFVRHARRLLQERADAGADMTAAHAALRQIFEENPDVTRKLRALWALHATHGADAAWLLTLLAHPEEHVRHWAVRLLLDADTTKQSMEPLDRLAGTESSWLVRLALASALQRIALDARGALAAALISRCRPDTDTNLLRLIWYGFQPYVAAHPAEAGRIALNCGAPLLRKFTSRRLAAELPRQPAAGAALFGGLAAAKDHAVIADLLNGANQGLKGLRNVEAPAKAIALLERLGRSEEPVVRRPATLLAATFGEPNAISTLRRDLNDSATLAADRETALEKLTAARPAWLLDDLLALVRGGQLAEATLRALASVADPRIAETVIAALPNLKPTARITAVDTLVARVDSARRLLDEIAAGKIERKIIHPGQARQIAQLGNRTLTAQLELVWGLVGRSSSTTAATIARLRTQLAPATLAAANLRDGAALFDQRCASCHQLFGRGQAVGPDLTGSGRKDLDYLLLNIVDPNASVPADYRIAAITLKDSRVLSGSIIIESPQSLTVRLQNSETTVDRADVKSIERLPISLMPPGLLEAMAVTEVRDLFGYLMSDGDSEGKTR